MENGAVKYGDRNWEKGQPLSRYIDSAMRHIQKYMMGFRDEDHLAAARWNLGALMHTERLIRDGLLPKELNDLPSWKRSSPMSLAGCHGGPVVVLTEQDYGDV